MKQLFQRSYKSKFSFLPNHGVQTFKDRRFNALVMSPMKHKKKDKKNMYVFASFLIKLHPYLKKESLRKY